MELAYGTTVATLADMLHLGVGGVAVALNNRVVPRAEWGATRLEDGDAVVVINASCGG